MWVFSLNRKEKKAEMYKFSIKQILMSHDEALESAMYIHI